MAIVVDFNTFKYNRPNYYLSVYVTADVVVGVINCLTDAILMDSLKDDEWVAYSVLITLFNNYLNDVSDSGYVNVKLHKIHTIYLKKVYGYSVGAYRYKQLNKLIKYLDFLINDDSVKVNYINMSSNAKSRLLYKLYDI